MIKRLFDIFFSLFGLIVFFPVFLILAIAISTESKGGIFYLQARVGKDDKDFKLYKFRSMVTGADKKGLLTVGNSDSRITKVGYYIRKYKLDELAQLINVFNGTMSFVGPRPEVRKYVEMYTSEQKKVLTVKPGITDYASIKYADENEILSKASDPEKEYIENVMQDKLELNMKYINQNNILIDVKLILLTFAKIFVN